jgi:hypothetical protein
LVHVAALLHLQAATITAEAVEADLPAEAPEVEADPALHLLIRKRNGDNIELCYI